MNPNFFFILVFTFLCSMVLVSLYMLFVPEMMDPIWATGGIRL